MHTKTLIAGAAACLALAGAAPVSAAPRDAADQPGQALAPEVVPGAGLSGVAGAQETIRHIVRGNGSAGAGLFRIDLGRTAGTVVFVDAAHRLTFRSLTVGSVRFLDNTATLRGFGLLNHRRVAYTAVGVHNQLPGVDTFRISWNHGAGHGGRVLGGSLFIR